MQCQFNVCFIVTNIKLNIHSSGSDLQDPLPPHTRDVQNPPSAHRTQPDGTRPAPDICSANIQVNLICCGISSLLAFSPHFALISHEQEELLDPWKHKIRVEISLNRSAPLKKSGYFSVKTEFQYFGSDGGEYTNI